MAQAEASPMKLNIPQIRPKQDATMVQPSKQEEASVSEPTDTLEPPQPNDVPPLAHKSAAEFAKNMADKMTDQFEEGMIGNLQPYQGTKPYQKGCRPGYFDLEDGQGGLVRQFKYLDPTFDISSGLKRVYYRTESFKGKTSYAVTKIEARE